MKTLAWNSLEEVFHILNDTVDYVVLNNFEELPYHFDSSIDILTDDHEKLIRILKPSKWRFFRLSKQIQTNIGGRKVLWNVHYVGDDYYCSQWQQDMLNDKILNANNVYVLVDEHYYFSFIYSSLIHTRWLTRNHYTKAKCLLDILSNTGTVQTDRQTGVNEKTAFPDAFDYCFDLLRDFMQRNKYVFSRPRWEEFNQVLASTTRIADQLKQRFGLSDIQPIRVSSPIRKKGFWVKLENCLTFYQAWLNGKKIFIKCGGYEGTHEPEFRFCNKLHKINQDNFPESPFYADDKHNRCVAYDFIEGELLEDKIKRVDFHPAEKENVIVQLKEIAKSLLESGIVHRDLLPKNFIITDDGKLKLVDFEFAVDSQNYEEFRAVQKNPLYFQIFFDKDRCDAILPLLDVLESIGCHESYQETYNDVESFVREHARKVFVKFKYQYLYYFQLAYNKMKNVLKNLKR